MSDKRWAAMTAEEHIDAAQQYAEKVDGTEAPKKVEYLLRMAQLHLSASHVVPAVRTPGPGDWVSTWTRHSK